MLKLFSTFVISLLIFASCANHSGAVSEQKNCEFAEFFNMTKDGNPVLVSPYDGHRDTLYIKDKAGSLVLMSTTHLAFLSALSCDSLISAVSGIRYVSDKRILQLYREGKIADIGFDSALDYEKILSIKPDYLIAYQISQAEPPYISKLKSLGINVLVLSEHLESHPLARAEYIKFFGALTGKTEQADSIFNSVKQNYLSLKADNVRHPKKVLMNIPFSDQWYIPGGKSYMTKLVEDAGGEILGADKDSFTSSLISIETAYSLSKQAEYWLNVGWCRTKSDLYKINPVFRNFEIPEIYNNIALVNENGGNPFWEEGVVYPNLILRDLRNIFEDKKDSLHYYVKVK